MLVAYKNDPKLKERFVKEVEKHRKADQLVQGTYGEQNGSWKGCAVACSLRSLDIINDKKLKTSYDQHKRYESELGIPEWLARLEDEIFEGLPQKEALLWPTKFSKAIPVGADLEPVKWKFCAYLMKENIDRVLSLDIPDDLKEQVVNAIRQVLAVHEAAIKTGKWDESAAWSAGSAAGSAAWSAAGSAAWSARSAAWSARLAVRSAGSAAWSAESAAESAARSVAGSAAWSAWSAWGAEGARSATFVKHSKELLKLLKASGPEEE